MSQLPFKMQVLRTGEIQVGEKALPAELIIKRLEPLLTPSRVERIKQVVAARTYSVATVTEHLYDIGNISAVMRSAESFGFLPVHIIERPGAKYKMSDRISRGTEKWLDIRKHSSSASCIQELKADGFKIYATDLNATREISTIDFSEKVAIVFGNEKDGITEEMRSLADDCFRIPMVGFAQSFNISVAAALCFYHIFRERTLKLGAQSDLTENEKMNLIAHYYLRTQTLPDEFWDATRT